MKGIDIFCTSSSSTAICIDPRSSMVRHSCSSTSSRAIDRHNPHLNDQRRRRSTSSTNRRTTLISSSTTNTLSHHHQFPTSTTKHKHQNQYQNHKSSRKQSSSSSSSGTNNKHKKKQPTIEISPTGSSRYLLSDEINTSTNSLNILSDHEFDPFSALVSLEPPPSSSSKTQSSISLEQSSKSRALISLEPSFEYSQTSVATEKYSPKSPRKPSSKSSRALVPIVNEASPSRTRALVPHNKHSSISRPSEISSDKSLALLPPSSPTSRRSPDHEVVVLRVSLHCKGCEGKVRKHISRMQGVTSFNIDFTAKKVTVIGDVTPLGVLASVSKVKNAQFWPSQWPSSPPPSSIP